MKPTADSVATNQRVVVLSRRTLYGEKLMEIDYGEHAIQLSGAFMTLVLCRSLVSSNRLSRELWYSNKRPLHCNTWVVLGLPYQTMALPHWPTLEMFHVAVTVVVAEHSLRASLFINAQLLLNSTLPTFPSEQLDTCSATNLVLGAR